MSDIFTDAANLAKDPFKRSRQETNAEVKPLQDYAATMKSIGQDQLSQYKNATTTAPQEAELKNYSDTMGAKTSEFYKEAGMSGSSAELDSMKTWAADVKGMRFDMIETSKKESLVRAFQSLGYSMEASLEVLKIREEEKQKNMQLYGSLLGTVGAIVGLSTGNPAAALVGQKVGQSAGESIGGY